MRAGSVKKGFLGWGAVTVIGLLILTGSAAGADRSAAARTFLEGVEAYRGGDYEAAVAAFEGLAAAGIRNPHLFYNLGNAHLKNGDLGPAILWYERALTLAPDDPDLRFNHAYAVSLVTDERAAPESPIYRILFFWRDLLGPDTVAGTAVGLNGLFWLVLIVRLIRRKRVLRGVAVPLLAVALLFTGTAVYHYYSAAYVQEGIVLPDTLPVRSGLSEAATELFVLHAGAKVAIEGEKEGFYRIFFSEGKIGWVRAGDIGTI